MKRIIKFSLTATLFSFASFSYAVENTTAVSVTPTERAKIESVVHDYLLRQPEILVEAMQKMQRKQYEEAEKTIQQTQRNATQYADALFHQANDPVAGNPKGNITVVEFFDYQCPHCVDMAPVTSNIIKANPNLQVIYKEFPIRGPLSAFAARAALAANKQGKYYEFSRALLAINQPLTEELILRVAKSVNLNMEKLQKDMNDDSVKQQLEHTYKLAQDLKLFGTPAFFIAKTDVTNNKGTITYIPGRMNQQQFQAELDKINK